MNEDETRTILTRRYPALRQEWMQKFTLKTFSDVEFKGLPCNDRKSGDLFGTLVVYLVGGASDLQFMPGMSEIPYPDQVQLNVPDQVHRGPIASKLDGTALLVNPFRMPDGRIKPLYRTRSTTVLTNSASVLPPAKTSSSRVR